MGRVWVGVLVVFLVGGCGGAESILPPRVAENMVHAEQALKDSDIETACQHMSEIANGLYEWQEYARGNHQALSYELVSRFEGVYFDCNSDDADFVNVREGYSAWSDEAKRRTTRKSSGMAIWFAYILVPLIIAGFLMFWRRKFREA